MERYQLLVSQTMELKAIIEENEVGFFELPVNKRRLLSVAQHWVDEVIKVSARITSSKTVKDELDMIKHLTTTTKMYIEKWEEANK